MKGASTGMTRRAFAGAIGAGVVGAAGLLAGCASGASEAPATEEPEPAEPAQPEASAPLEVFDLHGDTVTRIALADYPPYSDEDEPSQGTLYRNNGDISIDRIGDARWVQCYAIWMNDADDAISHIDWYHKAAAWFHGQVEQNAEVVEQARSFADIPAILDAGKVAAVLTVENAACLDAGFDIVDEFASDGVLISGITWNSKNVLGSGIKTNEGLTDLGRQYIAALEERNIVVDVSHLNDACFWELDGIATKPYIATHSNSRAVTDHGRNLTDDQFRAIVERGGLVGLNFHEGFVHRDDHLYSFEHLAAHVRHWLDLGGEDVLALGSDRDGSDVPGWLCDCGSQGYLRARFVEEFGEEIAQKAFFDNAMRFFGAA